MKIACLHTVESNVAIFEAARPDGVHLKHAVRPDLLAAAEAEGLTPAIAAATAEALTVLGVDVDRVLLTCSTLGPAAEAVGALRADAALADAAVAGGAAVEVLCAAPSTLTATAELFAAAAAHTGARVTPRLVLGAWDMFHDGDHAAYAALIACDVEASQADVVVLAQASMAPAATLAAEMPEQMVLSIPEVALDAALAGVNPSRLSLASHAHVRQADTAD